VEESVPTDGVMGLYTLRADAETFHDPPVNMAL